MNDSNMEALARRALIRSGFISEATAAARAEFGRVYPVRHAIDDYPFFVLDDTRDDAPGLDEESRIAALWPDALIIRMVYEDYNPKMRGDEK